MNTQPTLADVPAILLRTIARTIARIVFLLASVILLLGLALALASLVISSWRSARSTKGELTAQILASSIALARQYRAEKSA